MFYLYVDKRWRGSLNVWITIPSLHSNSKHAPRLKETMDSHDQCRQWESKQLSHTAGLCLIKQTLHLVCHKKKMAVTQEINEKF